MEQQLTRIAVKIGSNVLTRRDGTLDVTRMSALVDQVAELHKAGVEIILVSSGAVASGRSEIHPAKKLDSVDQRQLFSAVGQAKLINRYYELFREHGIPVGQVLTMKGNCSLPAAIPVQSHPKSQKNLPNAKPKSNRLGKPEVKFPIVPNNDGNREKSGPIFRQIPSLESNWNGIPARLNANFPESYVPGNLGIDCHSPN